MCTCRKKLGGGGGGGGGGEGKIVNIFLSLLNFKTFFWVTVETVLLCTHNICLWLRNTKNNF